ncbi:maltokinase N-terminal cap-like domain-containing protein [Nonomuraea sediminis]|uniref:maltokinase N-terminal cap-like domain-containing protein n=1 Tax=Nonomuraea sediminis TaxID=2835864 RepID=UPI001BDD5C0C|nr:phosphotransferase [Nonomuraea sediminis]
MLEELLARWITNQRWFAGKGRPIDSLGIESDLTLHAEDPGLRHLIISVWQAGSRDRYQLLLGSRAELPERLSHALIGTHDGTHHYDAAHDPALTRSLLEGMATDRAWDGVRFGHMPGVDIDTSLRSLVLGAEQSNTSLVYGDAYICKLFRRLIPGVNPEVEVVTALAGRGAPHIARPYGWIETDLDATGTTLAFMQEFLSTANDGWGLALASVRDLYGSLPEVTAEQAGGDFAAESRRLGVATARIHTELAAAFPTDVMDPSEIRRMAEGFRRRLALATAEVPALRENAEVADRAFLAVEDLSGPVPVQRVHGDYHLGQVMRTPTEWIVLDFEGEPGQPLAERRALYSPLRDVAGMLRSFEYASRHLLADHPDPKPLEPRAAEWADHNKAAFLEGYAAGGGHLDAADATLLRAFELSKAVYEVGYEARNRPSWLPIPLAAFQEPE